MEVQLDMYQTLAASVLVLMLGSYLKQQIHVLEKFCIPAPGRRGTAICNRHMYLLQQWIYGDLF